MVTDYGYPTEDMEVMTTTALEDGGFCVLAAGDDSVPTLSDDGDSSLNAPKSRTIANETVQTGPVSTEKCIEKTDLTIYDDTIASYVEVGRETTTTGSCDNLYPSLSFVPEEEEEGLDEKEELTAVGGDRLRSDGSLKKSTSSLFSKDEEDEQFSECSSTCLDRPVSPDLLNITSAISDLESLVEFLHRDITLLREERCELENRFDQLRTHHETYVIESAKKRSEEKRLLELALSDAEKKNLQLKTEVKELQRSLERADFGAEDVQSKMVMTLHETRNDLATRCDLVRQMKISLQKQSEELRVNEIHIADLKSALDQKTDILQQKTSDIAIFKFKIAATETRLSLKTQALQSLHSRLSHVAQVLTNVEESLLLRSRRKCLPSMGSSTTDKATMLSNITTSLLTRRIFDGRNQRLTETDCTSGIDTASTEKPEVAPSSATGKPSKKSKWISLRSHRKEQSSRESIGNSSPKSRIQHHQRVIPPVQTDDQSKQREKNANNATLAPRGPPVGVVTQSEHSDGIVDQNADPKLNGITQLSTEDVISTNQGLGDRFQAPPDRNEIFLGTSRRNEDTRTFQSGGDTLSAAKLVSNYFGDSVVSDEALAETSVRLTMCYLDYGSQ